MFTATKVHFCHQTWQLDSSIQLVDQHTDYMDIVVENTPFHPVSHIWPDHPADRGYLIAADKRIEVMDCLVGAIELETQTLYVGSAIPVKRDSDGWVFVVVHRVTKNAELFVGQTISLEVDKAYQESLSRGHSAGHIASLALNKVLAASYWRKEADRKDGLGHYDFNSYAQEQSLISPNNCFDRYRLGKTLKKRGLNTTEVVSDLQRIEELTNQQLLDWLQSPSEVDMQLEGPYLTSSRYWHCTLDGVDVVMPCGGTHVNHMNEFSELKIELKAIDSSYIEMHTRVSL
ncbi:Alanine--tRNA ligase [Vibrio thalassae]|uniref:Alanine--tRNA ligase n=1 Tax=Vibrio thalassae TaxID=1243014 RepID=A0A240EIQ7_9VIBR|nr:metal-dependent hydrolase [Vibrio thalassae]SNX48059.1 Alanine--tRNA ligase [Vibrio thalassae]